MIDALPGDSAAAVAKKGDDGYFVLIGGEVYGYVWKEKSKELRLRDGKALTVLVEHNGGDPNSYAQLFIPKPTK